MAATVLLEYTGQKEAKKYSQKVLTPAAAAMGKTQRLSRSYSSSGFLVESRHPVETTMCESEGLGSSAGVDTEMTASEASCAPRKKCISLNDNSDVFGVPFQVHSLSKMPKRERKELQLRLKMELEQVRTLQKKIAIRSTNTNGAPPLSSSSNVRSSSNDGQKKPQLENLQSTSKLSSSRQGKKRVPPPQNDGAQLKRDTSVKFESGLQSVPPSTSHVMLMKQCDTLLKRLMAHQFGWVFNTPVDIVKLNIPDYFNVIKNPMDLGTVKKKISSGGYSSPLDFVADVRLTFSNAMTYNPPGNDVHIMADTLRKYFEVRWKPVEKKLGVNGSSSVRSKSGISTKEEDNKPMPPSKKRKISVTDHEVKAVPAKKIMTEEDKFNLSQDIESISADLPPHIIDFLKKHSSNKADQTSEDDGMEIDIDKLNDATLLTLRQLVDDHMRERQVNLSKTEPCEMEVLNESGLSNLSMQPCKGDDPVDEDVDIGGNDPPVSSYPPIEIEKDTVQRNSKCSSSSSSSSGSGSSSSDSDSASSSGSESNGGKVSSPMNTKEAPGSGEALDQKKSDVIDPHDGNPSASGLDQLELNSRPKPVSTETYNCQDGESALSERQVSPEKRHRAALLRSRFADTIFKAQEKTLIQGHKGDPEKLRREKEELERLKKKEKARLQAEAKAAEDARRQTLAEAAAEAKRRLDVEREAARLALQQIKKTVEINENCRLLEDLEMEMRGAPAVEHLPSSVDETSPDHSEDCLGSSFKFRTTRPLEQLGLFMKMDDEEEEEVQLSCAPDPIDDVEEGEID